MRRRALGLTLLGVALLWLAPALAYTLFGRWPSPSATIHAGALGEPFRSALVAKANEWTQQTGFDLTPDLADLGACDTGGNLLNGVEFFSSDCEGDFLPPSTLAVTECTLIGDVFQDCGITFNSTYSWSLYDGFWNPGFPDFGRVALHEMGHFLGLGHEDGPPSIMSTFGLSLTTIQPDDVAGIGGIYDLGAVLQNLVVSPSGTQSVGTPITATASVGGGTAPYQYKWWFFDGDLDDWVVLADWGAASSYVWTPSVSSPDHRLGVWVRSAGNGADVSEDNGSVAVPIEVAASTLASFSVSPPGTQLVGTPITGTATGSGGVTPYQYKWWLFDGNLADWVLLADWSTAASFVWTPGAADPDARLGVWIRSAGSGGDLSDDNDSLAVPIQAAPSASLDNLALSPPGSWTVGTAITATASVSGGTAPYQYKWWLFDGSLNDWVLLADWGAGASFVWTPSVASPNHRVGVWVRSAGNAADVSEDNGSLAVPIDPLPPASLDSLSVTPTGTQTVGTAITASASVSGGTAPYQYKWWLFDGDLNDWVVLADWGAGASFVWTPSVASPNHRVGVWVRSAGNAADVSEDNGSLAVPIDPLPPASLDNLNVTPTGTQTVGTAITASASVSGGTAPYQYKWWLFDGSLNDWVVLADWGAGASFLWTPSVASPDHRLGVWVRSAGNGADVSEDNGSLAVPIDPLPPASLDNLNVTPTGTQTVGTAITASASVSGGTAPYQYKWWLFDGSLNDWVVLADWGAGASFLWTPSVASPDHRLGVWVRSAGNGADVSEDNGSLAVPIVPAS